MAIFLFLQWWYLEGWLNAFKVIPKRLENIADDLSISILFKTLFEPWKQIKINSTYSSSFDLKLHILAENLFSRFFGFFIRIFVIIFGISSLLIIGVLNVLLAIIWPLIPLLPVLFVILSVVNI